MNKNSAVKFINRMEDLTIVHVIRDSLVWLIPVLFLGAFALVVQFFPLKAWQDAIAAFAGGFVLKLAELINSGTFGVLSVYMAYSVSRSFMRRKADPDMERGGAIVASLLSFFILSGAYLPDFGLDCLGPKSMFLAILSGLMASALYLRFYRFFQGRRYVLYSPGADRHFNQMLAALFPVMIVALIMAVLDGLIIYLFHMDSFRMLLAHVFDSLFAGIGNGFLQGFLFVLLSSLLWFFGIHGSDTLEGVMEAHFTPGLEANQLAVEAGNMPQAVITKEFFDCFVLIGGCGTTICLLMAILLFSRNQAHRGLGVAATLPMIFNINELMVFGLPIIFNPIMLIPFLTVPLVCYTVSYLAISSGLVPLITHAVNWTTPVLLGGYTATGSVRGALLQLIIVILGVLIYLPFVRILDRKVADEQKDSYDSFMDYFRSHEEELETVKLTELGTMYGEFAKGLCAELQKSMHQHVRMYYQPQYRYDGTCVGVEALLRWEHPFHGMLYPPLVIKLAEEGGFLPELEELVLTRALAERPAVLRRFGANVKLSINVTGTTVVTPRFLQFCREQNQNDELTGKNICLEVTEQAALTFNVVTLASLRKLKDMGLSLAIDDFSMGSTSVQYLKNNLFDIIKLDGSLVRDLFEEQNCREIISSITQLAESLHLTVLAEFVETEEQRELLHEIGCDCYQGYLYSLAVPVEE